MSVIRYEHVHQYKIDVSQAKSIGDFIKIFEDTVSLFKRWEAKGVQLDPHGIGSSYAIFYTYDEQVAREEGFERIRTESGNPLPRR
ncbi:hypothetical protein GMST_23690 [Geomonas silvestris]|uniref:NIPSNAP domain-containing protein n=1 Tax=Geomonas silvestris TaxID=2740184 RepID=A0A6V8MJC0_9BACT|nr:hypothetical protein [Geomonas silvestris]GFO60044.1 hypothetical protein GMST_23690 [Geomonas silvestris]